MLIDMSELKPSDIEVLLELFHDNTQAISRKDYGRLMALYRSLWGQEDLDTLMDKIEAEQN